MSAGMSMAVFWVVAPCSPMEIYWSFRDICAWWWRHHRPNVWCSNTSETSVNFYQSTRLKSPEDSHIQSTFWAASDEGFEFNNSFLNRGSEPSPVRLQQLGGFSRQTGCLDYSRTRPVRCCILPCRALILGTFSVTWLATGWILEVRFPGGLWSRHYVHTGSGTSGAQGYFLGVKTAGSWTWPLVSI
jgi:hypothetical protein